MNKKKVEYEYHVSKGMFGRGNNENRYCVIKTNKNSGIGICLFDVHESVDYFVKKAQQDLINSIEDWMIINEQAVKDGEITWKQAWKDMFTNLKYERQKIKDEVKRNEC